MRNRETVLYRRQKVERYLNEVSPRNPSNKEVATVTGYTAAEVLQHRAILKRPAPERDDTLLGNVGKKTAQACRELWDGWAPPTVPVTTNCLPWSPDCVTPTCASRTRKPKAKLCTPCKEATGG